MRRSLVALAVVSVLVLAASVPASAQQMLVQLRYWSTNAKWDLNWNPTWTSSLGGVSIRRPLAGGDWALSFNYDTGAIASAPWDTVGQLNRFWNLNVHRNFSAPNTLFSLYGGWGSAAWEMPNWPTEPEYLRHSGPRVGADVRISLKENWYLVGDLGLAFSGTTSSTLFATGVVGNWDSTVLDAKIGLGYTWGKFGLEGGWRTINWAQTKLPAYAAGSCPGLNCGMSWSGLYLGVNLTLP